MDMARKAYIREEKGGPKASFTASTWPKEMISPTKNVGLETSHTACTWTEEPISASKSWSRDFP
jgi:hypothetical protein